MVVAKWHVLTFCQRFSLLYFVLLLCGRRKPHSSEEHLLPLLWKGQLKQCFLSPTAFLATRDTIRCQSYSFGGKSPFQGKTNWEFFVHWHTHCNLITNKDLPNISSVIRKLNWAPDQIFGSGFQSRKSLLRLGCG